MFFWPRRVRTAHFLLLLAAVGVVGSASAQSDVMGERRELLRQLNEYKQRVREVEERLRQLDAHKSHVMQSVSSAKPSSDGCGEPFVIDSSGLKRVRAECMEATNQVSCAAPFEIGENGFKRIRDACSAEASDTSSDASDSRSRRRGQ